MIRTIKQAMAAIHNQKPRVQIILCIVAQGIRSSIIQKLFGTVHGGCMPASIALALALVRRLPFPDGIVRFFLKVIVTQPATRTKAIELAFPTLKKNIERQIRLGIESNRVPAS